MTTETVGLALLHFCWQAAAVAVIARAALGAFRNRSAELRYAVALAAFAAMAALPFVTMTVLDSRADRAVAVLERPGSTAGVRGAENRDAGPPDAGARGGDATSSRSPERPGSSRPSAARSGAEAGGTPQIGRRGGFASPFPVDPTRTRAALRWLVWLWAAGVGVLSIRLVGGWVWLRRLAGAPGAGVPDRLRTAAREIADRMAISRPVRIARSTATAVPAVVGWLRPVILLPATALTGLSPAELEAIIAHELAHIRRHDWLVNLAQTVVETLFFYHPAVWWLSRQIREERENCCDDVAVAACGDARLYAGALINLESLRADAPGLTVAATGGSLRARVRRLFGAEPLEVEMFPRWTAGAAALSLALAFAVGAPAAATSAENPDAASPGVADTEATTASDRETDDGRTAYEALAGAAQDRVIVYRGAASLDDRWTWALEALSDAGAGAGWVAWPVRPTPSLDGLIYSDRSRSLRTGSLSMRGTMTGTLRGINPDGLVLADHVGSRPPDDVVLLLHTTRDGRIDVVRSSSFSIPVAIDDQPLVWLGPADAAESVPLLARALDDEREDWLRRDFVTAIGLHDDPSVVVPILMRVGEGDDDPSTRREATEWLGRQPDVRAVEWLVRRTEVDDDIDVRREAAEALGEQDLPGAGDALYGVARNASDPRVRAEAVEALGERGDAETVERLAGIARDDPEDRVRREAAEAIGEAGGEAAARELEALIASDAPEGVRREALESYAETMAPARLVPYLERMAYDTDERVARDAVEALGEVGGRDGLDALGRILRDDAPERVRREALEAFWEASTAELAVALLTEIALSDESSRMRREALDGLAELENEAGIAALVRIIRASDDRELRARALEALAESDDPRAQAALDRLLGGGDR